jgi:outer membrane protein
MKKNYIKRFLNAILKSKAGIFALLLLSGMAANAQSISLKECIEIGLKNHPDYQAGVLNAEAANASFMEAKSLRYPTMGIGVFQSTNTGRSIDRFTNAYINQIYNSTYAQASLSQPIFNGSKIQSTIRQNELMRDSKNLGLESTKNQLTIQIIQAYLSVLASDELLTIAKNQVISSETQLDQIEKQFNAGTLGKSQLLQIKTQAANDQFAEISASGNLQTAKLALAQLMNRNLSPGISFETIDASILAKEYDQSLADNALENLPEIKAADYEIRSFDSRIKAVKADKLPKLDFYADWNTFYASSNPEQEFFEQINGSRNGSFSLGLRIPIFARFQTNPKIQTASIQKRLAENRLASTKLQVNQAVQTAIQQYNLAAERYNNAQSQVAVNQENIDAVHAQINAGTVNSIEFILAKTNYDRANSNLVQAKYSFLLQEKILNFYEDGVWEF